MNPNTPQQGPRTGSAFLAVETGGTSPARGGAPAPKQTRTFTILNTNDIHSNLIGVGPASEYSPSTLNDDSTIGGIERLAALIGERGKAREADGPVLVLDGGDISIGTPFGGAFRYAGAELQCLWLAGYDAITFGNHDFDFGPAALAEGVAAADGAGRVPPNPRR